MIATNSLAAFTAEVSRSPALQSARAAATPQAMGPSPEPARRLEALPPPPSGPMPRGSLLDLKV